MTIADLKGNYKVISTPQISTAEMNNPFNIKAGGQTTQYIDQGKASMGRAAPDGGNFLTFKDRNDAVSAAQDLLFKSGVYKGLTVDSALKKWSNNGYGGNVIPDLASMNIDSLTPEQQTQVLNAMETKGENDAVPSGVKTLQNVGPVTLVDPSTLNTPKKNRFLPGDNIADTNPEKAKAARAGLEDLLPMAGSIAGGIGGAALGGLAASPTVLGIPAAAYAGGVAGAGLGAAAGTSLQEAMQGKKQAPGAIATQGAEYAGMEALGIPAAKAAEPFVKAGINAVAPVVKKGFDSAMSVVGRDVSSIASRVFKDAVDISRPKLTTKLEQQAFDEGRVGKQGWFKGASVAASKAEAAIAEAIQPYVQTGEITAKMAEKDPSMVKGIIENHVSEINQGVKDMVRRPELNIPFTESRVDAAIAPARDEFRSIFGSDKTITRAYDSVIDKYKTFIKTKNVSGLLDSRQAFDAWAKKTYPKAFTDNPLTGETNPRVQALHDIRTAANHLAADLLDEAQIQKVSRWFKPKEARGLIEKAANFAKKSDFVNYAKNNMEDYPEADLTSTSQRKIQENQNTDNQYSTTRDQDLGELWDMAQTNISPTAGDTFTSMLRKEADMLRATKNLGTKVKGITQTGKVQAFLNSPKGESLKKLGIYATGISGAGLTLDAIFGGKN